MPDLPQTTDLCGRVFPVGYMSASIVCDRPAGHDGRCVVDADYYCIACDEGLPDQRSALTHARDLHNPNAWWDRGATA